MVACGHVRVGGPVDGFLAVGVEAGAEADAGGVHVRGDCLQPFGEGVQVGGVDRAGAGCPEVRVVADGVCDGGEQSYGCGGFVQTDGPCVEGVFEVELAVSVEQVEEGFADGGWGFAAGSSTIAGVVSVGAVEAVVFEVVEVVGEPGEVLACLGLAVGAGGGGVWVVADAAGHVVILPVVVVDGVFLAGGWKRPLPL